MANIFLDTAPIIYLIENHPLFGAKVQSYLLREAGHGSSFATSVVTLSEFSVIPERTKKEQPIADFHSLMGMLLAPLYAIDQSIGERTAKLRAAYPSLKGMDGLQIACALHYDCDTFLTNDRKLSQIQEIQIVLVEDL